VTGERRLPQGPQHRPAVALGHHDVEQDRSRRVATDQRRNLVGIGRGDQAIAGAGRVAGIELQGILVVIDHQDGHALDGGQFQPDLEGFGGRLDDLQVAAGRNRELPGDLQVALRPCR